MELHLHLNVVMDIMFLSASLRLEAKMGSIETTNVVVCLSAVWRLLNQTGIPAWMPSCLWTALTNLMQSEVFSVWEERQICPVAE